MSKKASINEIDANFIISAIKDVPGQAPPPEPAEVKELVPPASPPEAPDIPKEENRRRRGKQDYEALFLKDSTVTTRSGKSVSIRKESHDRIMRIIHVIGGNEISLFSYLDNVLEHHFATFQEDITEAYNKKNQSIF